MNLIFRILCAHTAFLALQFLTALLTQPAVIAKIPTGCFRTFSAAGTNPPVILAAFHTMISARLAHIRCAALTKRAMLLTIVAPSAFRADFHAIRAPKAVSAKRFRIVTVTCTAFCTVESFIIEALHTCRQSVKAMIYIA